MRKYLLLIISVFFININVYALNDIYIQSIEMIEKSEDTIINDNQNVNLTFNNVGEQVRYKINIVNNRDKNYYIDSNYKYDNVNLKFSNNKIVKNDNTVIYLDVSYDKLVNSNNKYFINDLIKVKLVEDNSKGIIIKIVLAGVLLLAIVVVCILISKIDSLRIPKLVLIGLVLIPICSLANNNYLKLKLDISINYNSLLPSCVHNKECFDFYKLKIKSDDISLITKKSKKFDYYYKYNEKDYSLKKTIDVSYGHTGQVLLGIYYSIDNSYLLVLGQNNGVVLPNDSSYLFRNTNYKNYDLNSINSINTYNMSFMFSNIKTDSIDISNFDTSNVKSMGAMFYKSKINDINISNIDLSSLYNINYMFSNTNINNLIGYKELDFSKVQSKKKMFYNSKINHIY